MLEIASEALPTLRLEMTEQTQMESLMPSEPAFAPVEPEPAPELVAQPAPEPSRRGEAPAPEPLVEA